MKIIHLFFLMAAFTFSSFGFAGEEDIGDLVKPIEEKGIEEASLEQQQGESHVGNLFNLVQEQEEENVLLNSIRLKKKNSLILRPYAEDLFYINGQLCHVGNYSQSIITTVLEGPYYGTQTTTTYDGIVLYVNYEFEVKHTFDGVILYHYYDDSKVITGANQVIKFY